MKSGRRKDGKARKPPPERERITNPNMPERVNDVSDAEITPVERYALSLIEYSFDIILLVDRRGKILYVSPSTERLLGYRQADALGTSIFDYIHPEDERQALNFYYDRSVKSSEPRYVSFRIRHCDGSWRHLEAIGNNLLDDPFVKGIVVNARDITDKRRLELELKRSEEYFRSITENTSDVITVLDAKGIIRYVSPSMERAAGYESGEVTGKHLFDFAHPEDVDNASEALNRAVRSPGVTRYTEIRIRHKDGSWHHYEAAATNLLDNPVIKGIVIHARDITERRQWEEVLRESEEKYRLIYDFTGEAIYTYDTNLTLIGVNRKACELIGYEEKEVIGKNILELGILHPEDFERTARDIQKLFNGEVVNDELRFIAKDGSISIGDVTGAPLFNSFGEIIAFTNVAHDITERKIIEIRMNKLNRCLLGLGSDPLENIKNIVLTGRDAMNGLMMSYCRMDKGRMLTFYSSREDEGFVKDENPEGHICFEALTSGGDEPTAIEDLSLSTIKGAPAMLDDGFRSYLGYPVKQRGKTVGCLCLFGRMAGDFPQEDVNFISLLARALTIEEERLAHEESIRHFVDIASHELRTPLSIIKGYADAFQYGDLLELSKFQMDKIRIINTNADKMTKTINDLLDISRIERGQFIIEKEEVEVEPLINNAVRQMREKGFEDRFSVIVAEELESVELDREKFLEVLMILLDNAVNYSPNGSEITINVEQREKGAKISVADIGPGIQEGDREIIFERFYQVEDSRYHSQSGMGLGLYIARQIIEGHGGEIWYEPREGGGSVFSFYVP